MLVLFWEFIHILITIPSTPQFLLTLPCSIIPNFEMNPTVENSYGAMLLGAFLACCLSGIVTVQSFLYIKLYPSDRARMKFMVNVIFDNQCFTPLIIGL